ncbi:MAG: hypothetical protein ACK2UI_16970 [Anaerolineae bacterium]
MVIVWKIKICTLIVLKGVELGNQNHLSEAAGYFQTVIDIWPESKIAKDDAQRGLDVAFEFMERLRPERIKNLAALSEGDGVSTYFSLMNKDDVFTAVPGTLVYQVFLRNRGALIDKCYEDRISVAETDFENAIVGMGVFQRKMLIFKLPFLKWRTFECGAVRTYLEMGGIAGLEQMPIMWDFSVRVLFVTEQGDKLESVDTFRP